MGKKQLQEYFNGVIDWKFFNALRDRLLKYEDMGNFDCEIKVEIKIDHAYYGIFRYKSDNIIYGGIKNIIKHLESNNSHILFDIFINDSDCLTEFVNSFNSHKYGYYAWRNGAYDVKYKKGNW